ncbi:CAP-Gly domain-containing protein [Mycena chlorophos]|uniref:CAP-Gly domain-containing protein n=1 Tax=Mycena chlorophos TaxID=658473 RepID=A0A8H6WRZ2_MYCCL|nr:CAP-Gly domain-containing protein [Mycena chlorophos]
MASRLRLGEHTGTLRYRGPVDGTAGEWLGIEWDDPARGKHDGVKDGRRYFTCRIPNAGSFIRPAAKDLSFGTSFLDALNAKYIEQLQGPQESVVLGSSRGAIQVEAVDLDKIRAKFAKLDKLREISLDTDYVARYDGPEGSIRATCPNVRGLDLSVSLIPDWKTVSAICTELPQLQRLSLNRTRLTPPMNVDPSAFENLIELRLNATLTTWQEMQLITRMMPLLRTVEIGHNRIAHLEDSLQDGPGSALESINLDSNALQDWEQICSALSAYPALDRVVLTSNSIRTIPPRQTPQPLLRIAHLSLSHNEIASWSDLDALSAWCPRLETLTMLGNPLFDAPRASPSRTDPEQGRSRSARQLTIARIPSLLALDAGAISPKERVDSELFYLSHVALHGPPSEDARVAAYPRWVALCEKHGRPDEPEQQRQQQDTLGRRLIDLNIYPISAPPPSPSPTTTTTHHPTPTLNPPTLVLPPPTPLRALPSMTLRALRLKLRKTAKQRGQVTVSIWLQTRDGTSAAPTYALLGEERDAQDLAWLGIESGSNILFRVQDGCA